MFPAELKRSLMCAKKCWSKGMDLKRIFAPLRFISFVCLNSYNIATVLKIHFEGGGVVLKFHFKIPFLQSCFLTDQYSSSFHVIGKMKYLRLAPEEPSTYQTEAAHA
jgi:hypothetical protein